jgi:hypothetical protein
VGEIDTEEFISPKNALNRICRLANRKMRPLAALRAGLAGGIAGVPGRLAFGFQLAFALRLCGRGALGLQSRLTFRLPRPFGLAGLLLGFFRFARLLDRRALGRTRRASGQPLRQRRVAGLGLKLLQRRLLGLGCSLLPLEETRLLKAAHQS